MCGSFVLKNSVGCFEHITLFQVLRVGLMCVSWTPRMSPTLDQRSIL